MRASKSKAFLKILWINIDIMEDASMVDHDKHDTVVKVGFLNKHDDQKFDDFKTVYDVIVQEDGSMHAWWKFGIWAWLWLTI